MRRRRHVNDRDRRRVSLHSRDEHNYDHASPTFLTYQIDVHELFVLLTTTTITTTITTTAQAVKVGHTVSPLEQLEA